MNRNRIPNRNLARRLVGPARAVALILATTALGACVVAPARPYPYGGAYVTVEPPPPQVEVVGVAPAPG